MMVDKFWLQIEEAMMMSEIRQAFALTITVVAVVLLLLS